MHGLTSGLDRSPRLKMQSRATLDVSSVASIAANRLAYLALLLLLVNVTLRALLAWQFPLLVEEAYCWQCSLFPAFGYVEYPPLVIWLIQACRQMWEVSSAGSLRLLALAAGTCTPLLVYALARQLTNDRRLAWWALITSLVMPGLSATGILVLPDTCLLLFSLVYLNLLVAASRRQQLGWWIACGVALGLAVLSKLSILLVLLASLAYLLTSPSRRKWLRQPGPYVALGMAALVAAPYLYWLATHVVEAWSSFAQRMRLDEFQFSLRRVAEVLFEQLPILGPLVALPAVYCLLSRVRESGTDRDAFTFVRLHTLVPLAAMLLLGTFGETHPSWMILAYPTAAVAVAMVVVWRREHWTGRVTRYAVIAQAVVMTGIALAAPAVLLALRHAEANQVGGRVGAKLVYTQEMLFGWSELAEAVDRGLAVHGESDPLVFCDERDTASMLAWHGQSMRVVNLGGLIPLSPAHRESQKDFVPYESIVGASGLFVTSCEWTIDGMLAYFFEEAAELELGELAVGARKFRGYRVAGLRSEAVHSYPAVAQRVTAIFDVIDSPEYLRENDVSDRRFVQELYLHLFGRAAEAKAVAVWVDRDKPLDRRGVARTLINGEGFWRRLDAHGTAYLDDVLERMRSRSQNGRETSEPASITGQPQSARSLETDSRKGPT